MKEQETQSGSVDSDILQGKADVLRAVRAAASEGKDGRDNQTGRNAAQGAAKPIQVQVRPVVAVKPDRERAASPPPKDNSAATPAQAAHGKPAPATSGPSGAEKQAHQDSAATDKAGGQNAANGSTETATQAQAAAKTVNPPAETARAEAKDGPGATISPPTVPAAAPAVAHDANKEPKLQPSDDGVPRFKLAEQILAEQRKNASERRQRSTATEANTKTYTAQDTVGAVIREVKNNLAPISAAQAAKAVKPAADGIAADDDGMTPIQRQIIAEIVARDIALFSSGAGRRKWPAHD